MCAILVREPFNLSFAEIARLTDYQIARILFHPRDDDGSLARRLPPRPKPMGLVETAAPEPPQEVRTLAAEAGLEHYLPLWWAVWHQRGLSLAELVARWREYVAGQQRRG